MARDTLLREYLQGEHLRFLRGMKRQISEAHMSGDMAALNDLRDMWDGYNKLLGIAEVLDDNSEMVRSVIRMEAWLDSVIGK